MIFRCETRPPLLPCTATEHKLRTLMTLAPSVVFLRTLKQEGMIAGLLKLSDDVQK